MKIDWSQVPSQFTHAHAAAGNTIIATSRPLERKGEKLAIPKPLWGIISADGDGFAGVVVRYPTGPNFTAMAIDGEIEAGDVATHTQVHRPSLASPVWELLPEEVTGVYVDPFGISCNVEVHSAVFETIKRMNLREGRHVRHNISAVGDGECIHMAVDVMRDQRAKGMEKYGQPLEANEQYTLAGMLRMAQEELADGAVYLSKLQMMIERLRHLADHGDIEAIRKELRA